VARNVNVKVDASPVTCHESAMPLLVANWKMHGSCERVVAYASSIGAALETSANSVKIVFCPPAPYISAARQAALNVARFAIGAQNCHHENEGAFTGEVSAAMLKDNGATHVILGHSERRALGETDLHVAAKVRAAQAAGMMPIICIGESQADYEAGRTKMVLDTQLAVLTQIASQGCIIAYEPIWAIGSGKTPKSAEIQAAHTHIKTVLGSGVLVLYGGSVKSTNLSEILALKGVDGALIGGASLDIGTMQTLIQMASEAT
jgi:triosephosphate isomerase